VAGGGDIRGVQLAVCFKYGVGVCDKEDKTGGSDDGVAGAADGVDIRGVNSQAVANTLWVFTTMGTNPGKWMMGQLERWTEEISGELTLRMFQTRCGHLASFAYTLIFLFDSVVPYFAVCRQWILMINRVFVS
jgi:hypothetical protein